MKEIFDELRQMNDLMDISQQPISDWLEKAKWVTSVSRIPGDASNRKYYRVKALEKSFILMKMESFADQKDSLPFLVVARHLLSSGVDVPQVLDLDAERGLILLEDLGDITLLRQLQGVSTSDGERHLYEKVIDSLVKFQVFASPRSGDGSIEAFRLRFDYEKLMWEVDFTIEHLYKTYLKRDLSAQALGQIRDGFSEICSFLAEQPTTLTHRDFHSRNVMISGSVGEEDARFVMIDFQDARMGPAQYDLASLLKDSYYQLEESQVVRLVDYYIARFEAASGKEIDRTQFVRVFDFMSIQRNFKAIGSFASFMNRRGDPTYLKYIGNTFENIRKDLLKYPRYSQMREALFFNYYF